MKSMKFARRKTITLPINFWFNGINFIVKSIGVEGSNPIRLININKFHVISIGFQSKLYGPDEMAQPMLKFLL